MSDEEARKAFEEEMKKLHNEGAIMADYDNRDDVAEEFFLAGWKAKTEADEFRPKGLPHSDDCDGWVMHMRPGGMTPCQVCNDKGQKPWSQDNAQWVAVNGGDA